ncbi:MAG: adenylate/guanylate cyclase domain-containing protein, partial [Desulfofustis sp.]
MAKERVKRKLSAILCADVVGYSRLMGEDEAATLSALNSCDEEIIEPTVKEHNGRIFKRLGDGFLVEFSSAVDSVECALSWQKLIGDKNHPLKFRIGINLGDVIAQDDDVYGDGVNIAARIEKLADPGGICISQIYDYTKFQWVV